MAVAKAGALSVSTKFTGAGPHTHTWTVDSGADAIAIVILADDANDATNEISSVQYTQGATLVSATQEVFRRSPNSAKAWLFSATNPDSGAGKSIKVTLNNAMGTAYRVFAQGLSGVDQTTPVQESDSASSTTSSPLSLDNAPFTGGDSNHLFIGGVAAHANITGWTAAGGANDDASSTDDGGWAYMAVSASGTASLDPTVDQGTTTRSLAYVGGLFAPTSDPAPTSYTVTDDSANNEVDHAWTNADGNIYRKQIWRWDPGESPGTDPGVDEGIWPATATSASTPRPTAGGTYTYRVAVIDSSDAIVAVSNTDTATINVDVPVPAGSLAFTGLVPTITNDASLTVPVGSMAFTGLVPLIDLGAGGVTVSPPTAVMAFTGLAPDVTGAESTTFTSARVRFYGGV
jgi:hypothetical protein